MIILSIGRDSANRITLNDPTQRVSGVHAELKVHDDGSLTLKDTSRNGTFVNGKRLPPNVEVSIQRSDVVSFANAVTLNWSEVPIPPKIKDIKAVYTMGTASDNKIMLIDSSQRISRYHAELKITQNDELFLYDKSSGGTYVNDRKIPAFTDYPVKRGDVVSFAKVQNLDWTQVKGKEEPQSMAQKLGQAVVGNNQAAGKGSNLKLWLIPLLLLAIAGVAWQFFSSNPDSKIDTKQQSLSSDTILAPCNMDMDKIHKEYANSVVWVYNSYYHTVEIWDGKKRLNRKMYVGYSRENGKLMYGQQSEVKPFVSEGSGFFIKDADGKEGFIVTNRHVAEPWKYNTEVQEKIKEEVFPILNEMIRINGRSDLRPTAEEGESLRLGIITNGTLLREDNLTTCEVIKVATEADLDIAILRLTSPTLPDYARSIDFAKIRQTTKEIKVGDAIFTIGFPDGSNLARGDNKDAATTVGGDISRPIDTDDLYMHYNMPTYNGASGSPIFDKCGNVIGIVTLRHRTNQYNRGIKADYIHNLIQDMYDRKSSSRSVDAPYKFRSIDGEPSPDKEFPTLNRIYYDYDKANISPDAALELDKVVEYLKKKRQPHLILNRIPIAEAVRNTTCPYQNAALRLLSTI